MSLLIRRIAIENFRKFREKREIAGLAAGLNIVIEPNETGKSTVLEAVRAALFLKHNSKTQLITSFQPHGDEVAPEIELDFAVGAEDYALKKRFIGRAMAELSGPSGRSQNAEAEERLQRLLGFEQGRGYDDDLAGALGMLWVAQSEGLSVSAPGSRVRDLIGATLEGEAGTILGSATFERVRTRIEGPFREYLTATGRPTGKYTAAQQREKAALDALAEAEQREQALEAAFAELDQARRQLATLRRDLDDGHDAAERADLEKRLETARGAAQLLAQRQAEAASAKARADSLHDLSERHAQALRRQTEAEARRDAARSERAALSENLEAARMRVTQAATGVDTARTARDAARTALAEAQARALARRRHEGVTAAHARHAQVVALEAEREALAVTAASSVPAKVLKQLEDAESEVIRHRTLLDADGTRVELIGAQGVTRDGTRLDPGEWTLTRETRIGLPGGGELVLRPSQALAGAQAALDAATARRTALLHEWSLASLADARTRNEAAREAQRQAETLEARLLAAAPADRDLGLAAGADALKVFVAANPLGVEEAADVEPRPLTELEAEDAAAEDAVARADAFDRQAIADLRDVEMAESPLAVAEQTALAALETTAEELAQLAARPDFADLAQTLPAAREASAAAQVALEQARAGALAFDEDKLRRQIEVIAKRRKAAEDRRNELGAHIAALEAKIESEGGKGLAEHAAAAREEADAARAARARVEDEAETLRLLRDTLAQAQAETARTITGPVAQRAARYVGRILPGGELAFGEDLGLASIRRGGLEETCEMLSKGTQEQLAVLTRLAFADMLLEEGRPVSLILDDPLVYADDIRLDAMIDLITEVSERMQVILLTCRERAFRHVEGNRIRL
ncbi:MAG: AAA family ATPase [Novosphingobium aromaticivorans]|nr:AAA family ATPase [Novosphingobium aromaticivorans]